MQNRKKAIELVYVHCISYVEETLLCVSKKVYVTH